MIALAIASTAAVFIGLSNLPYGYFVVLRLLLCVTAAFGFSASRRRLGRPWLWVFAVLAVLYNPIFPVRLGSKAIWILLNFSSLFVIWIGALRLRAKRSVAGEI